MGSILITIICLAIIEIYLFISIGSEIGAIKTIFLIFSTAIIGVYYAKYEGLKTLKSSFVQLSKNEPLGYEILSGAGIAFAALLLIIPGFLTDLIGFLLIFPVTRKFLFRKIYKKKITTDENKKNDFIEGEFEDIDNDDERKI
tara:strand:- start:181 stop:609 length:429 start_codon:yes stop_codon:yes gene_type:complete